MNNALKLELCFSDMDGNVVARKTLQTRWTIKESFEHVPFSGRVHTEFKEWSSNIMEYEMARVIAEEAQKAITPEFIGEMLTSANKHKSTSISSDGLFLKNESNDSEKTSTKNDG